MLFKMSDEKQSTNEPTVVISASEQVGGKLKSRLTKKHVLIAGISLLITGLIVTGVLVGIRLVTDSNLEIAKYSLSSKGVNQNVSTSENSVIFHVTSNTVDAWVVQDFSTGLQVSKVISDGKTVCYVTALNKSAAVDPSSIPTTAPAVKDNAPSNSVVYKVAPEEIPDISFLGKKGSALCHNIPTYHAVPDCGAANNAAVAANIMSSGNSSAVGQRNKRTPAFCATAGGYLCACGCCALVCGRFTSSSYVCSYYSGSWHCTYWMSYIYGYGSLAPYGCWYGGRYYNP